MALSGCGADPQFGPRRAANAAPKNARRAFPARVVEVENAGRCAPENRAMEQPLCALGAFNAKKSKRFVTRLLRTDKVFVYFT
jgi:hypothetical protein